MVAPPELVNTLVVIADNAYIVGTTGQQAHQVEHWATLVSWYSSTTAGAELLLIVFRRHRFQHLHGMENKIVKSITGGAAGWNRRYRFLEIRAVLYRAALRRQRLWQKAACLYNH